MLLQFSSSDILNTNLVDTESGETQFTITTSATLVYDDDDVVEIQSRRTSILNTAGAVVAEMEWVGEEKRHVGTISIMQRKPVTYSKLFDGCESVKRLPNALCIPSRLGFIWMATRNAITIFNSESSKVEGKVKEDCLVLGGYLFNPHIVKTGHKYLQLRDQPEEVLVELLVDYLLMDIMRRTYFNLPKYDFTPPQHPRKLYSQNESKEALLSTRKFPIRLTLRRSTL